MCSLQKELCRHLQSEIDSDSDTERFLEKRSRLSSTPVVPYSNSVLYDKGVLAVVDTTFDTFVHTKCNDTAGADLINVASHAAVVAINQHRRHEFDDLFATLNVALDSSLAQDSDANVATKADEFDEFFIPLSNTAQVVPNGLADDDFSPNSAQEPPSCSLMESAQVAPNGLAHLYVGVGVGSEKLT